MTPTKSWLRSIRSRLLVATGAIFVLVFAISFSFVSQGASRLQDESLERVVVGQTSAAANGISALMGRRLGYVQSLAATVGSLSDLPDPQKRAALERIIARMAKDSGVSAIYVNFEPGAYYEAGYSKPGTHPGVGCTKGPDGLPVFDPASWETTIAESDDWYNLPMKRAAESVIEPYRWAYGGSKDSILMVSVVVPVRVNGRIVGIAGADIPLSEIQLITAKIKPITGSYSFLVSGLGARIAHPKPELLTKVVGSDMDSAARKALLDSIAEGHPIAVRKIAQGGGKMSLIQYEPVRLGSTGQHWSLGIVFPVDDMLAPARRMQSILFCAAAILIALMIAILAVVTKRLLGPLRTAAEHMRNMAQGDGDLTRRIQRTGLVETDRIGEEFNHFAEVTRGMVAAVVERTDPMHKAAEALQRVSVELDRSSEIVSSRALSTGSEVLRMGQEAESAFLAVEQSGSNLERIAAAVEQMNASISEVAHGATLSRSTGLEALDSAREAGSFVSELAKASQEIEKVIEIIVEISEQTKLLALNATIEAARAGEAGRGFAVVAGEVKELAKGTAEATEDIRTRVGRMKGATGGAVDRIARIQDVIGRSSQMQATIAASVEEQSSSTREIASSLGEVVSGVRSVRQNLGTVVQGVKQVGAEMEEVAGVSTRLREEALKVRESSGRLAQLADGVKSLLGRFRV